MKRICGLWALLILTFTSCAKLPETPPSQTEDADCRLTLALAIPDAERITRALAPEAEKSVADMNLYLFSETLDKHYFFSPCSASLDMSVPPGTYELYLIANAGSDLGAMTRQEVDNYRCQIAAEGDIEKNGRLMMYARQSVTIENDTNLSVALVRLTAKVEIRYSVASGAGALTLKSIQVKSAPTGVRVFDRNRAATAVTNYAAHTLSSNTGTLTAYVLENCKGVNSSVTSQALKDSAHAPQNSTYVVIKGYYADKAVAYTVYLGENATSDFNVRENRHYVLNVQIFGANPGDCRVSVSEMTLTPLNATYPLGATATTTVTLTNQTDPENSYSLSFRTQDADVVIGGTSYISGDDILLLQGIGSKQIQIGIRGWGPDRNAAVTFTVTDRYGVKFVKTISTTFVTGTPIIVTSTPFSNPVTNSISTFSLTIAEPGYSGDFTVSLDSQVEPAGAFTFRGENLTYGFQRTVGPGTYPMTFDSSYFTGEAVVTVWVRDNRGNEATYYIRQNIQ